MDKPMISKFDMIAPLIIQKYERYLPTAFDESMTLLEKINKVIEYMNKIGLIVGDVVDQWNEVMEWVMNDGLTQAVSDKLDEMVEDGTLGSLINDVLLKNIIDQLDEFTVIPRKLEGEATHSPAIKRAIDMVSENGFGTVLFIDRVVEIDEPIIVKSNVRYQGRTKMGTTIKIIDGANCDAFKSENFELLSTLYNGGNYPINYYEILPYGFIINDFFVDGNYLKYDSNNQFEVVNEQFVKNNTIGYGLKIYARNYEIDRVRVQNIPQVGAYFECKDSETGEISIQGVISGEEGFIYRGSPDSTVRRINFGKTGYKARKPDGTINQSLNNSSVFSGKPISGIVFDSAVEVDEVHTWENYTGYGLWYTNRARNKSKHIIVDNCLNGLLIDGCITQMSLYDGHNVQNNVIELKGNVSKAIDNINIFHYSSDLTFGDQIVIAGNNNKIKFTIQDASLITGVAVLLNGFNNRIEGIVRNLENDVVRHVGGYRNEVNIIAENCLNVLGVNTVLYHNYYRLNVSMLASNQTIFVTRNGGSIDNTRNRLEVQATRESNNAITRNLTSNFKAIIANVVSMDDTNEQIITIPHNFYKSPHPMDINIRLDSVASVIGYSVAYLKVVSVSETEIVVRVKLATPSSIVGSKGNLFVRILE